MGRGARLAIAGAVAFIGVLCLVAGIMWLVVASHSLPSFFPGTHKGNGHHTKRGTVAAIIGAVLIAAGAIIAFTGRRRHHRY